MRHIHFDITDSTSVQAATLAQQHPGEPFLVSAAQQTAGRGRADRLWQSPVGGAWFTIAWPTQAAPGLTAPAPLVVGLTVLEEVSSFRFQIPSPPEQTLHENLKLKWPNDILLGDRKLAGILCEQRLAPSNHQRTVLLGVGINANLDPATFDTDLRRPAVSLSEMYGRPIDVQVLIQACATRIISAMRKLEQRGLNADTRDRINTVLAWRGQRVALHRGAQRIEGILHGIDHTGGALIDDTAYEAGEVDTITPEI